MDHGETQKLVVQLAAGFQTLQDEYQQLFRQQQAVERKLATAREQYNELAKLCGAGDLSTPPLSLTSNNSPPKDEVPATTLDILHRRSDKTSTEAVRKIGDGISAAQALQKGLPRDAYDGVRIWNGPSADKPEASSSMMPSISESPLEQDFTIEGKPSKLGCPFASMANKKLSSHAASVLSRYNTRDGPTSASQSSVGRINGRDSFSQRQSRRASIVDPIKAEICGLSDHKETSEPPAQCPMQEHAGRDADAGVCPMQEHTEANADTGVCPIRFLDQHSPEEVATYFEKHKHELPRSHEVCVRRYQSNEQQIKQLDAKYGNLVSMIQGLGEKHKGYLPDDPDPDEQEAPMADDARSHEKIQQWASSVSAQAVDGQEIHDGEDEERQPHFERPLRDIRVGESPSRPWGISVPAKYIERNPGSDASSVPAMVGHTPAAPAEPPSVKESTAKNVPVRCPFGFDKKESPEKHDLAQVTEKEKTPNKNDEKQQTTTKPQAPQPVFISQDRLAAATDPTSSSLPQMVFNNCPVFIGYSVEDATRILKDGGFRAAQ